MCIRDRVYLVTGGEGSYPSSIADYPALDAYKAVVLDSGKSLNVALSGAPDNGEAVSYTHLGAWMPGRFNRW